MRTNEVDLVGAVKMLELPEEVVCRLAEEGKLKSRRADGTLYFSLEQIEVLARRQVEEARSQEAS
jgi:hypothetical protein